MKTSTTDAARHAQAARAHLRQTLAALGGCVSAAGAIDAARAFVDDDEIRQQAVDFVKRHPVPTAVVGAGLAWLGYRLLVGGDAPQGPDPRTEPGLTEVPGRAAGVCAPLGAVAPAAGRRDVPRVDLPPPSASAPVAVESGGALARLAAVRETFSRHPLLYGVVGLVAGAVMGVVAAVRGRSSDRVAPALAEPGERPATHANGGRARLGSSAPRCAAELRPGVN